MPTDPPEDFQERERELEEHIEREGDESGFDPTH